MFDVVNRLRMGRVGSSDSRAVMTNNNVGMEMDLK